MAVTAAGAVSQSIMDQSTLATIAITVAAGLGAWMFRIDRLVTGMKTTLEAVASGHKDHCDSDEVEHTRIWQAHEKDVGNLSEVDKRVAVVESHILPFNRGVKHGPADAAT